MTTRTHSREDDLKEVAEHFARDMKVLFSHSVAARKNLKRARKQIMALFDRKMRERGRK